MKKLLFIILTTFLIVVMTSCEGASKVPEGMSQEMYDLGKKTSDITQKYVDGDLTAAAAYQQTNQISDDAKKIAKTSDDKHPLNLDVYNYIDKIKEYIHEDDSVSVVDYLNSLNDILTPAKDNESNQLLLSDVLDGTWNFEVYEGALEGHIIQKNFSVGTYHTYDYAPNNTSPTGYNESDWGTTEYRIDDEKMEVITKIDDMDHRDIVVSNLKEDSFDFVINPDESPQIGKAYKQ